jgi:AcrR family transcriptional regulator
MPFHAEHEPTEQRQITRQRTIDAAIRCLRRDGYARTTLKQVANEAGVTWGVFQYHFGDKRALLAAVFEHLCNVHAARLRHEAFAPDTPLRTRVERFVAAALGVFAEPEQIALLEMFIATRSCKDGVRLLSSKAVAGVARTYDGLWWEIFHDAPVSRRRNLAARRILFAALHGFVVQCLIEPDLRIDQERRALVDAVASLLGDTANRTG